MNNKPSLNDFTVTDLPAMSAGKQVKFKIQAKNKGGYTVTSRSASITIASVPSQPSSAPVRDSSTTSSDDVIRITYTEPNNGGSPISNYEIKIDNGIGGGFITIAGGESAPYLNTFF